jgi:hypothetical protein
MSNINRRSNTNGSTIHTLHSAHNWQPWLDNNLVSINRARAELKVASNIRKRKPTPTFQHLFLKNGKVSAVSPAPKTSLRRNQSTFHRLFSTKKDLETFLRSLFLKKTELVQVRVKELERKLKILRPSPTRPLHIRQYHTELKMAKDFYKTLLRAMEKQKNDYIKAYRSKLPNTNVTIYRWPMYVSKFQRNPAKTTLYFHPSTYVEETEKLVDYLLRELVDDKKNANRLVALGSPPPQKSRFARVRSVFSRKF